MGRKVRPFLTAKVGVPPNDIYLTPPPSPVATTAARPSNQLNRPESKLYFSIKSAHQKILGFKKLQLCFK